MGAAHCCGMQTKPNSAHMSSPASAEARAAEPVGAEEAVEEESKIQQSRPAPTDRQRSTDDGTSIGSQAQCANEARALTGFIAPRKAY